MGKNLKFVLNDTSNSEAFYGKLHISGVMCMVTAFNSNGQIRGVLSSEISTKNFKFEIDPINERFKEVEILNELDRLYFDVVIKGGSDHLKLCVSKTFTKRKSFLIKIKGCKNRQCLLSITNLFSEKKAKIETKLLYKQHDAEPYWIDFSKVITFEELVSDFKICAHSLKCSGYNFQAVAEFISKKMIFTKNSEGVHELIMLSDL